MRFPVCRLHTATLPYRETRDTCTEIKIENHHSRGAEARPAADGSDFAIQLSRNSYPSEFRQYELASSPLAVFVRRDHPLTQQPISEKT